MKNVLIIGAHYDDAELGAGGTAAKLVAENKNVYKLTLTDNVTKSSHLHINVEYETSVRESALACDVLGVKEIAEFQPVRCNQLFYDTEIMQRVEDVLYQYEIDTVFMHYTDDLNQDHISASKICLTATRHCDNVFLYQSNLYVLPHPFEPTFFLIFRIMWEKNGKLCIVTRETTIALMHCLKQIWKEIMSGGTLINVNMQKVLLHRNM